MAVVCPAAHAHTEAGRARAGQRPATCALVQSSLLDRQGTGRGAACCCWLSNGSWQAACLSCAPQAKACRLGRQRHGLWPACWLMGRLDDRQKLRAPDSSKEVKCEYCRNILHDTQNYVYLVACACTQMALMPHTTAAATFGNGSIRSHSRPNPNARGRTATPLVHRSLQSECM